MGEFEDRFAELEVGRAEVIALLRSCPTEFLGRRPESDDWSVLENARHLIYAEQLHFRPFFTAPVRWSRIGMPTGGKPQRNGPGTEDTDDLEVVLETWDEVHAGVVAAVEVTRPPDALRHVDRNLRHLRAHARGIRRLVERLAGS